jgi:hypothetical protein
MFNEVRLIRKNAKKGVYNLERKQDGQRKVAEKVFANRE